MEKNYTPTNNEKKMIDKKPKAEKIVATPTEKVKEENVKVEEIKKETEKVDEKTGNVEKKEVKKKAQPKIKRNEVSVYGRSLAMSTKKAMGVCKFIKGKPIQKAIDDLEKVVVKKMAVPLKGEYPHRKGKMMAGGFPEKASEHFIMLLKSLNGNATHGNMDEPIIYFAVANSASRPFGKFGRVRHKRTHVEIRAKERKLLKEEKK